MTTILPEGATVVPVGRTPPGRPCRSPPCAPSRARVRWRGRSWPPSGSPTSSPGLFVNYFLVYFTLFSMGPALTPLHLNTHRVLVVLGVLCVGLVAACGAARGGWRWSVAAGVVLATSVSLFRVQGAIPGF